MKSYEILFIQMIIVEFFFTIEPRLNFIDVKEIFSDE